MNAGASRLTDILIVVCLMSFCVMVRADESGEDQGPSERSGPIGHFITVTSPVDDVMYGRVKNLALELQDQAIREDRSAVLVLEITPGSSRFGNVHELAKFLVSSEVSRVRTVAWIPETVIGNNVVLALSCEEIILHPDASLGDIGRGRPVDEDEQQIVLNLIRRKHNRMLSPALVQGMLDPSAVVMKAVITDDAGALETQVLTVEELKRKRDENVAIQDVETVKEAGMVGLFSAHQANRGDFLIVTAVSERQEICHLYGLPLAAMREDPAAGRDLKVWLVKVDGMIEPVLEAFIQRQVWRALNDGVNLIVFEIESPGGFLLSGQNLAFAIADLDPKVVRTVAWVPKEALSSAAIIAMGCDEIYMHPDAQIGDAGPIEMREGGQFERAPEKIVSSLRVTLSTLAEKKGRSPALLMAMADRNLKVYEATHRDGRVNWMTEDELKEAGEVWKQGSVVPESETDLLLTLNGRRAHELRLAEAPVTSMDELKDELKIPAEFQLKPAGRTWVDTLIYVLNTQYAMFLLFMLGVGFIYLELHFTTGLLGILSAVCFGVFFWSRFLVGTATELEIVLFLIGVGCIVLEIFVVPGFGVFGVSGGLLIFTSMIMASHTFGNLEPGLDVSETSKSVGTLAASIVSVIVLAMLMNRFLPHIPILNQMILAPPNSDASDDPSAPRLRPEYTFANSAGGLSGYDPALVGQRGVAASTLRPAGKAQIGDAWIDVVSDGDYIKQGTPVKVVKVSGNLVIVRQIQDTSTALL